MQQFYSLLFYEASKFSRFWSYTHLALWTYRIRQNWAMDIERIPQWDRFLIKSSNWMKMTLTIKLSISSSSYNDTIRVWLSYKCPLILLCRRISVKCPTNFEWTLVRCHFKLIWSLNFEIVLRIDLYIMEKVAPN